MSAIPAKMKLIVLLSCLIIVQADVIQEDVIINGVHYEEEILHDNLDRPSRLTMDYATNDLYFAYRKDRHYYIAKLNVNTKEFKDIEGVVAGTTVAVDQENRAVYLGGLGGIYKYNVGTEKLELVGTNGQNNIMWKMFFKDVLYFIALPSNFLYTFENGQSTRFEDVNCDVDNFVIDSDDVMYFNNYSNFYRQKKGTKDSVVIENVPFVRALNTDKNGKVYACSYDGIYKAVGHSAKFTKVVDDIDAIGIAFDSDNNVIYSDRTKIIRLKPVRR